MVKTITEYKHSRPFTGIGAGWHQVNVCPACKTLFSFYDSRIDEICSDCGEANIVAKGIGRWVPNTYEYRYLFIPILKEAAHWELK